MFKKSRFYDEVLRSRLDVMKFCQIENTEGCNCYDFVAYNNKITIGGKYIFDDNLFKAGLWRINDFYKSDGELISFEDLMKRGVPKSSYMTYRGIRNCIQQNYICNAIHDKNHEIRSFILDANGKKYDLMSVSMKQLNAILVTHKRSAAKAIVKHCIKFNLNDEQMECMFLIPRYSTCHNIIKDLQYKILYNFLGTNRLLYKMGKIDSDRCTFCNLYRETVSHLFYECIHVRQIWGTIMAFFEDLTFDISERDVLIGYDLESRNENHKFVNICLLLIKMYIWQCKLKHELPNSLNCILWLRERCDTDNRSQCLFHTNLP